MFERRRARIVALEILYQKEITHNPVDKIVEARLASKPTPLPEFSLRLVQGVQKYQEEIDSLIKEYAQGWSVKRMPFLDRNIVRIALYEMLYEEDIPYSVSINEAVELAKRYGTEDSSKFINGILGKITQLLEEKAGQKTELR